jgi:hypothetical protein
MDGRKMKRPNNIYVSLQLDKDQVTGELVLNIQFDKTAPNFSTDKGNISWYPTAEELDFVSEAFSAIGKGKSHQLEQQNQTVQHEGWEHSPDGKEVIDRVFEKKDRTVKNVL